MARSLGPSPGAIRHPDHLLSISNGEGRWTATVNGKVVADSQKTLALNESRFSRTVYFPPGDVFTAQLLQSNSRTTCPFKGEANYYAAESNGKNQDIAWFYPEVYDEVSDIRGYVAFYADRVDVAQVTEHA